ncbi:UDP-3-O-(3-hydroxymyristoyl)glucosamine N-acyltransferase [Flavicella sediminum]|uniref:UDP-3-O-(3-hydroxymyristoyl)glucosamine N-acyltransferase n=1 Tax=Flavicella sediminum TaxID=2585141 RepID=UPI00111F5B1E|nr:UDP-3-O-(3-hydroxymyristoyl)glucosamine N-acyltransferase [Flavicella sediminum]
MKFTAIQIAEILEGEVVGNPEEEVSKLSKIEEGEPGSLTFLSNEKYTPYIYTTHASVAIVNKSFTPDKEITTTLIKVPDAYKAFSTLLSFYNEIKNNKSGFEEPHFKSESAKFGANVYLGAFSHIGQNVVLGDDVKIYPNCFIGDNVEIGEGTTLFAGVKIYSETQIGKNCKIHSGAVIGADGFGFAPDENGEYSAIPQIGNVVIGDHVDIGANTAIDRATLGSTKIGKGVKLDNFVQIAHNVEVGANTVIAAITAVAGSTKIGENCMIGGQVAIAGHISIGNGVKIQGNTGVASSIKDNAVIKGTPAYDATQYNRSYVHFKKLPSHIQKLEQLEKEIKALKES